MKYLIPLLVFIFSTGVVMTQTKVIAHRGFSSEAPENTLTAFQKAIDIGADYFELDVHKTKDNRIVVIHDNTVDKTTSNNSSGEIENLTLLEISEFRVGYSKKFGEKFEDEKIPTLEEALSLAKDKIKVCIEIKVENAENEVLNIIEKLEMHDQVIIFSFYYNVLKKIRGLNSTIPILYLKGNVDEKTVSEALEISAQAIGVGKGTILSSEFVQFVHRNGLEIWQWTVNEESEMQKLFELKADGIITDYPNRAMNLISK